MNGWRKMVSDLKNTLSFAGRVWYKRSYSHYQSHILYMFHVQFHSEMCGLVLVNSHVFSPRENYVPDNIECSPLIWNMCVTVPCKCYFKIIIQTYRYGVSHKLKYGMQQKNKKIKHETLRARGKKEWMNHLMYRYSKESSKNKKKLKHDKNFLRFFVRRTLPTVWLVAGKI